LALRIDSQSIQQTADNAKTTMENQYSKLKGKNLDAPSTVSIPNDFVLAALPGLAFDSRASSSKLPPQANSTSLLVYSRKYQFVLVQQRRSTSKTD
jgi:hypothetical protein